MLEHLPFKTILVAIGMLGAVAVVVATSPGVGISPDSVAYVEEARNLAAGHGYTHRDGTGTFVPVTHSPPLFPGVLGVLDVVSVDPVHSGRWLNVLSLGLIALLAGGIVARHEPSRRAAAVVVAAAVAGSVPLLQVSSMLWSEPLFIVLLLAGTSAVLEYLRTPRLIWLVAAGGAFGLCTLTRYVGGGLLPAAAVAVAFKAPLPSRARLRSGAILFGVGMAPVIAWLLRNQLTGGNTTNRPLSFHPAGLDDVRTAAGSLGAWVVPRSTSGGLRGALGVVLAAAATIVIARAVKHSGIALVTALLAFGYVATLIIAKSFYDAAATFNDRYLAPLLVLVAIGVAVAVPLHRLSAAVGAVLAVVIVVGGISWTVRARRDGMEFASRTWKQSPTLNAVSHLPPKRLYSNIPDVISFYTDRPAGFVPVAANVLSGEDNPTRGQQLASMARDLRNRTGVIVWFNSDLGRTYLVGLPEIQREAPLRLIIKTEDGAVYEAE